MIRDLERASGRTVSRETFDRLRFFGDRLKAENNRQNLVSATTIETLWDRHILDSAQLVRFEPRPGATWVDVGSGAGLPGIVVACLVEGSVALVEPRRLRSEFLRAIVAELDLRVTVEAAKVEAVSGEFDVITGRAVASLPRFLALCHHLSTKKTIWILPKGRNAQSELAEAQGTWQGMFHVEPSLTGADSKIIVATQVRAGKR